MCVIAFAKKGVEIPTPEQIRQMWEANPDGAGFAYEDSNSHIVYKKGFMTIESLLKELEHPERFKNTNFAIHFRIGTSGRNDSYTCHPFPLSTNFGELRKTSGKTDAVLFHNGIFSQGKVVNQLSSDTQDFVVAFAPLMQKWGHSKARDFFMEKLVGTNKLLILYKNNRVKMYGQWEKDGELLVSNTYYQYTHNWATGSCYASAYDFEDDDLDKTYYKDKVSKGVITHAEKSLKTQEEEQSLAEELFEYIIEEGYADLMREDVELLKKMSSLYSEEKIYYKGYEFGYFDQMVWLEKEPKTSYKENKEALYA